MGHWNTNYLDKAIQHLGTQGVSIPDELLAHVAPLGWENIALTGDYDWSTSKPSRGFDRRALFPRRSPPPGLACSFEQTVT